MAEVPGSIPGAPTIKCKLFQWVIGSLALEKSLKIQSGTVLEEFLLRPYANVMANGRYK